MSNQPAEGVADTAAAERRSVETVSKPTGLSAGKFWGSVQGTVRAVAGIAFILVLWEAAVRIFDIPQYLLVGPVAVAETFINNPSYYLEHSWVTFYETILGFVSGLALAVIAGIAIYYVPLMRSLLYPSLIGLNTIPKVAVAPLFVVWFGAGTTSKVVVALLIAFFPILVATVDGLNSVPSELRDLARVNSVSPLQRFRQIDFMYALPDILTGMKISISMAVGGAVVGEFIAGQEGLGFVVIQANALVRLSSMFAAFLLLALMAFVLFLLVELFERVFLPWARFRDNV